MVSTCFDVLRRLPVYSIFTESRLGNPYVDSDGIMAAPGGPSFFLTCPIQGL